MALGQNEPDPSDSLDISAVVYLDSFVVTASKNGFDVDDFIQMVKDDETFIYAFHNLRFLNYESKNVFNYFNKKGESITTYDNLLEQVAEGNCRKSTILREDHQGKYFKSKKKIYRYYTSKMHHRLFYAPNGSCTDPDPRIEPMNATKMEKYVSELKKLVFKPGEKAEVPLVGKKTAIFSKSMSKYYDYKIKSEAWKENTEAYVFEVIVKPEFQKKKSDKTVIKYLKTYFDKSSFQVLGRNYQLAYNSALYDFDVEMVIELSKFENKYVPVFIQYDGFWDVPMMKRESCKFELTFFNFN